MVHQHRQGSKARLKRERESARTLRGPELFACRTRRNHVRTRGAFAPTLSRSSNLSKAVMKQALRNFVSVTAKCVCVCVCSLRPHTTARHTRERSKDQDVESVCRVSRSRDRRSARGDDATRKNESGRQL